MDNTSKTNDWPHQSPEVLMCRIFARVERDGDCWIWRGWRKKKGMHLYLAGKGSSAINGQPHHLLWWLLHNERIFLPRILRSTCGNLLCINPEHREIYNRTRYRRWTSIDVRKMREEYWGTSINTPLRPRSISRAGAVTRTSRQAGILPVTVKNALVGRSVPERWNSSVSGPDRVIEMHAAHERGVERDARRREDSVSMKRLALRHGVSVGVIAKMLNGVTYKQAGGPTGTRKTMAPTICRLDDVPKTSPPRFVPRGYADRLKFR